MAANSTGTDPCLIPLIDNPSGAPPNFGHGAQFQPITIGVVASLLTVAYLFVSLRVLGSVRKERRLFIDDCKLAGALKSI